MLVGFSISFLYGLYLTFLDFLEFLLSPKVCQPLYSFSPIISIFSSNFSQKQLWASWGSAFSQIFSQSSFFKSRQRLLIASLISLLCRKPRNGQLTKMGSFHQSKRSDNKWYAVEVRGGIFEENLTFFFPSLERSWIFPYKLL